MIKNKISKFYFKTTFLLGVGAVSLFVLLLGWMTGKGLVALGLVGLMGLVLCLKYLQMIHKRLTERYTDYAQVEGLLNIHRKIDDGMSIPPLRGYALSPDILDYIFNYILIHRPKVIVELGSGVSTHLLSRLIKKHNLDTQVYAIEHDGDFIAATKKKYVFEDNIHIIHAPLKEMTLEGNTYQWYDLDTALIPDGINLLVVDGPIGIQQKEIRYPTFARLHDKMSQDVLVVVDDAYRRDEQAIVEKWKKEYGFSSTFKHVEKGAIILKRQG